MHALWIAVIAGFAMFASDFLYTLMVQSEATGRAWIAGVCDALGWMVGITTTSISVTTFAGHSLAQKLLVGGIVTAANLFGTVFSVHEGAWILRRFPARRSLQPEIVALQARVAALEAGGDQR